jgi:hypothetical protein
MVSSDAATRTSTVLGCGAATCWTTVGTGALPPLHDQQGGHAAGEDGDPENGEAGWSHDGCNLGATLGGRRVQESSETSRHG